MVIIYIAQKGWVVLVDVGYGKVNLLQYNTISEYISPACKHMGRQRRVYHRTKEDARLFGEIYHNGMDHAWGWL